MSNFFLSILFSFSAVVCVAQSSPVRFQNITINDGLSLSSVYCIKKDSKGFMWFGTEDGLNRFDGYHFKIFRTDNSNANSICYKWIEHIEEDNNKFMWFGSRNGLSCYNPAKEVFTNFKSTLDLELTNDTVTCLKAFGKWILAGTMNGLNVIESEHLSIHQEDELGKVNGIISNNDLCFIASANGLFKLNAEGKAELFIDENEPFVDISVEGNVLYCSTPSAIFIVDCVNLNYTTVYPFATKYKDESIDNSIGDHLGRLWISTPNGLFVYHYKKGWIKQLVATQTRPNSLAINTTKSLLCTDETIWFATHGDGLFLINSKLQVTRCVHNPTDSKSISQNAFNCIFADHETGNIWLGTYGAGINVYPKGANKFDHIKHNPLNSNSLPSDFVWSVFEAEDSCLWIGTNDKGLCKYCPSSDNYRTFSNNTGDKYSLSNNSVRKVFQDSEGIIWVGTDGGGLNRYDASDKRFTCYMNDSKSDLTLSDNSVRVIYEDSQKRLWIGTRNGLNLMNKSNGTFHRYKHILNDSTSLSHNFIYSSIKEDKYGNIWLGTYGGGLNKLNPESGVFEHYTTTGHLNRKLSNDIVFSIYEDKEGLLWIGTNEGLNVLNPETGLIKVYGTKDGLPNEVIYGIMPDDNGNIWLSTNNGISCVTSKNMKIRNYDVSDGLQSNEFNGGAFHKGKSGRLYFGGVYGLNILIPDKLSENQFVNKPIITRLEVLGSEVQTWPAILSKNNRVAEVDSQYVLHTNISYSDHITLDYSQRFFAIEYSGLNHLFPSQTQYAFQLYPLDKKWNKAGNRNYVSFSNLKNGDYEFRVTNTNSDGVWGDAVTKVGITILPPFWLSNWFILLEIILFVILVVFIYRYLLKIKMNKILFLQNQQIKEANMQLQLSEENLKAINATKDKFFSIISHDLKNPFTSLMSISDMLCENYDVADDEDRKVGVQRIQSSVKNIYYLLENLLTWSRSQRGKICFQAKPFDLSMLISENVNLYRNAALRKNIRLINNVDGTYLGMGDRNTINTIIRNLSGNAVKFTNNNGQIMYSISDKDDFWKVSIRDNGIGIKAEDQERLFCIDKKIKTEGTSGEKGTGLGLIICKEFADKNGGQIGVNSEFGSGSEFWFLVKKVED